MKIHLVRDVLNMELYQMQIYEFIDRCSNNRDQLTDEIRYQIPDVYSETKWIDAGMFLISHLNQQHQMPSKDIETLIGISVWHKQGIPLTNKQRLFFTNTIIDYWDQLDCQVFIKMNL